MSNVIDIQDFKRGQANIIIAPCHSGKTTAAIQKIAALAECRERVIFLIDTNIGKKALLRKKETNRVSEQWLKNIEEKWWGSIPAGGGIRIMSYHQFGHQLKEHPDLLKNIDVLICDELHNIKKYMDIERAMNKMKGTQETACKTAFEEIVRASKTPTAPYVVAMTATVRAVSVLLDKVDTEYFDYTDRVTRDITTETVYYNDINTVLKDLPLGERAIVYVPTIHAMKDYAAVAEEEWHNVCCLWGIHNMDHAMSAEQLKVRNAILTTQRVPDEVDVLFINAAYETSININNEDINTVIVHSGNPDTQVQVRGRLRHDINTLYIYDPEHEHIRDYFPEEYCGRFLTSKDTAKIADEMNLRDEKGNQKRWPAIVRLLIKDGFIASPEKQKGKRGWIIHKGI